MTPLSQIHRWLEEAQAQVPGHWNAMSLATVDSEARPDVRTVIYRHLSGQGNPVFYTSLVSKKSRELQANAQAAISFYWQPLHRQLRIQGRVQRLPRAQELAYFETRGPGYRRGAMVSDQQQRFADYDALVEHYAAKKSGISEAALHCPEHWGGFELIPDVVEFWSGAQDGLHRREVAEHDGVGWRWAFVAP